ncbi:uncharacterized protein LOC101845642 [Aplysia californica]|uniref:Uncharacterized protein LOC101845642 n=1 Tax=Aplysia californica TaxID=6500 RepID=A0ABM0K1A1_APLCA|nr:uncharacterized protein LOC101845642 [Aplysia californica]
MAMPPGGPMEVVFSFDTTGSMSQVLDEVKGRINDIVQRLQADIPGFRVGIIAHGDYCDAEHFYDIRLLDLTENVVDVVTFVANTEGTGGGDIPECYELALRRACEMSWSPGSRRVLVVIGDAYPHGPDYDMNKDGIDWTQELNTLISKDVKVYGVQVQEDPDSTSFFQKLSRDSGGQHLKLANMGTICQVIMGICYREQGAEMFLNYEAELRAKQGTSIGADLENVLGTLRHDDSVQSLINGKKDDNDKDVADIASDMDASDLDGDDSGFGESLSTSTRGSETKLSGKIKVSKGSKTGKASKETTKHLQNPSDVKQISRAKRGCAAKVLNQKERKIIQTKTSTGHEAVAKRKKRATQKKPTPALRPMRECVSAQKFAYKNLSWSRWQPAVIPAQGKLRGQWRQISQSGSQYFWRSDLLKLCKSRLDTLPGHATLFEVGVHSPGNRRIKVVYVKSSKVIGDKSRGVFSLPWYSGMFRSIRKQLNESVNANGCVDKVCVRWAFVNEDSKAVKKNILKEYDYAWNGSRSDFGVNLTEVNS